MTQHRDTPGAPVPVPVWDLPTRLFHWLLVALFVTSGITGQFAADIGFSGMLWHQRCGYAILALLLFRLAWGFAGGTHARFASFLRGPAAVADYLRELLGRRPSTPHLGHNPLGGWSVVLMLASLAVQVGAGLFLADEDLGVEGPFARFASSASIGRLGTLHAWNFWLLAGLVGLHVGAVACHWLGKGENLVRPMWNGIKWLPRPLAEAAPAGGEAWRGLLIFAVAVALVWLVVTQV